MQMAQIRIRPSNKSFIERLFHIAVFFGIPMSLLELIGAPRDLWLPVLAISVPFTMIAVFFLAIIEHWIMRIIRR
jgi:hypothetical protein